MVLPGRVTCVERWVAMLRFAKRRFVKSDDLWRSNMGMTVGALETLCCSNRFYGFYIDANSGYLTIANHQNQKCNQTEEA